MDNRLLSEEDLKKLERAKFNRRVGIGRKPAIVVIDVQNYMIGTKMESDDEYPSACGEVAYRALKPLKELLDCGRMCNIPIIYTKFELRRDGRDIGVYGRKRELLKIEGWCLEDSIGVEIADEVKPAQEDIILIKKKPSAFFGTPLLSLLINLNIDTLVITGGSTSNCVRATAVDSMSYNYRTIVVEDCSFDRIQLSHQVALMDLDRQYADVMQSNHVIASLSALNSSIQEGPR